MEFLRQAASSIKQDSLESTDAEEPLLRRSSLKTDASQSYSGKPQQTAHAPVDLGWQFVCRLYRVLQAVNAAPALILLVLSIMEAVIVSKVGTISGMFYQVFVDGERGRVLHLMLWSSGCYAATALFYTLKVSLQDFFAWRWRASLTCQVQQAYCSSLSFYTLKGIDSADQRLAQDLPLLTNTLAEVLSVLAAAPFNVFWYTRLTHQVFGSWCPVAAAYGFFLAGAVLQRVAMLPVARGVFHQEAAEGGFRYSQVRLRTAAQEIAIYRSVPLEHQHLTQQLALVLACQGRLLLRRAVLTSVTKVLEYGGLIVNFGCLAGAVFSGVWDSQRSTPGGMAATVSVASFYLLTLIYSFTQVLDLATKVSNLAGLTARVSQLWEELQQQQQRGACNGSNKHVAEQHQTAFNFHELECQQRQQKQRPTFNTADHQQAPQALHLLGNHGAAFTHKRYASQAVTVQPPQLITVAAPTRAGCRDSHSTNPQQQQQQGSDTGDLIIGLEANSKGAALDSDNSAAEHQTTEHLMQVSVHSLGSDVLLQEVRRAFPESPRLAPLCAVVTFQFCGQAQRVMMQHLHLQQHQQEQNQQEQLQGRLLGSAAATDGNSSDPCIHGSAVPASGSSCVCSCDDMRQMLDVFLTWQHQVHSCITSRGYWCDAVDPRTGHALHGVAGCGYDEVIGAQVMLGYDKRQQQQQQQRQGGGCPLVSHPLAGTQVYPATLFTSAPLSVLREALTAAAGSSARHAYAADTMLEPASTALHQTGVTASAAAADRNSLSSLLMKVPPDSSSGRGGSGSTPAKGQVCVTLAPGRAFAAAAAAHPHGSCHFPLLVCQNLTVSTPVGALIVQDLTLSLTAQLPSVPDHHRAAGAPLGARLAPAVSGAVNECTSLLIQGPSGCGKTTLLKCLAGLWPADSGSFIIAGNSDILQQGKVCKQPACDSQSAGYRATHDHWSSVNAMGRPCVMFVPQKPLTAPGSTLRDQLAYPAAAGAFACCCNSSCGVRGTVGAQGRATYSTKHSGVTSSSSGNSKGDKSPGNCVVAIREPQRMPDAAGSSLWAHWLTCGILQQQQQLQQQSHMCFPTNAVPAHTDEFRPCNITCSKALHSHLILDTIVSKQQHRAGRWQHHQQVPTSSSRSVVCPSCKLLLTVVQQVGLMYLLNPLPAGLDTAVEDWGSMLSPGELQRLAFARVLLHRPVLAVLDEATSSLPDAVAIQLYHQLQHAHVSYISAAHSSSLKAVHDQVLTVSGEGTGSWRLHAAASCGAAQGL